MKGGAMPTVRIRERGQVTIPAEYRKDLGLEENDTVNIIKADDALILTRKKLAGDTVAGKFEKAMKKKGMTLDSLLEELRKQRAKYGRETYGSRAKT
jgi:AbrB family looped-hinge helix DNA binding protein